MQRNPVLTEIQLPSNLHDFVVEHSTTVATHGLEIPLIAHITNIWLEGVISRQNMVECMRIYDKCGFSKTKRLA